jgi:hypothetical protein
MHSIDTGTGFWATLREQRWDDHRYYHHSRINQSLHLVSALSFLASYVLIFLSPAAAALVGWLVAMTTRQAGHFFFEPKGYDEVNQATHEYKEAVKVGYNLQRKVWLLAVWALVPALLWLQPSFFGLLTPATDTSGFIDNTAVLWIAVGLGGLLFRVVQLALTKDLQTGVVWATKIITDPFHDVMLYHKAPYHLLRGELIDPMRDVTGHGATAGAGPR